MNIIFLDIDGVLCTARASVATGIEEGIMSYLDPIGCRIIKKLCDDNNAQIVISSTWRLMYSRAEMVDILNKGCEGLGNLICHMDKSWRTRSLDAIRGIEIAEWLMCNDVIGDARYVIIDDDSDMGALSDHLVQCDTYEGIGFKEWLKADKILKGEL